MAGLEYSSGVEGVVVGKPEAAFFESALEGGSKEETVMVGDVSGGGKGG